MTFKLTSARWKVGHRKEGERIFQTEELACAGSNLPYSRNWKASVTGEEWMRREMSMKLEEVHRSQTKQKFVAMLQILLVF